MNVDSICQHFEWFEHTKTEHKIETIDIWNMDESGFRIDVDRGQWMIISIIKKIKSHQFTHLIDSLGNTEHITVIEAISAGVVTIDFFIITKGTII